MWERLVDRWKTGGSRGRLLEQLSPDPGNIENIARGHRKRSLRTLTGPTHDTVTMDGAERTAGKYYERRFRRSGKYGRRAGVSGELLPSTPRTVGTWFCKCFANWILSHRRNRGWKDRPFDQRETGQEVDGGCRFDTPAFYLFAYPLYPPNRHPLEPMRRHFNRTS